MGSTRLQPGACCGCGCLVTICVVQCITVPVYGATVAILSGGVTVVTGTTGTGGCVALTIPSAGTYTVQVTVSGSLVYNAGRSLTCNGTVTIPISAANVVCCGGYAIPYVLTLTDAAGSLGFCFYPSAFYPTWYGGHALMLTSCAVITPGGTCTSLPPSTGPVKACYQMVCYSGSSPTFSLLRNWSWVYEQGTLTPIWYQDASGFSDCNQAGGTQSLPCATAPPASCGSPLTDSASGSANPSSTSPFLINFSLADNGANATADPVGSGSVSVSA